MAERVSTEDEVALRIKWIDDCHDRLTKLVKDQGKAKEILVPTIHVKQYVLLLHRLRMLERHLSNMVLTHTSEVGSAE